MNATILVLIFRLATDPAETSFVAQFDEVQSPIGQVTIAQYQTEEQCELARIAYQKPHVTQVEQGMTVEVVCHYSDDLSDADRLFLERLRLSVSNRGGRK